MKRTMYFRSLFVTCCAAASAVAGAADWPMFGQNLQNTAAVASNSGKDVAQLAVKWKFTTQGDVSARAAVVNGVAYFPDWGGYLHAVNTTTGVAIWSKKLSDYALPALPAAPPGFPPSAYHSRTTPAVAGATVYLGTQEGAYLLSINATTGNLNWATPLEPGDPYAIVTTSPAVSNGVVYTGVASTAEGAFIAGANLASLQAAGFARGSAVAVNAANGVVKWQRHMVPPGYTGGGVWGSNVVVDEGRGSVFVATGNNYTHPTDPAYVTCIAGGGTPSACSSPNNHVDSILALDSATGAIKWSKKFVTWDQAALGVVDGSDDWNVDCLIFPPPPNAPPFSQCPTNAGPDYDFASTPNLITYGDGKNARTILGAGQKSGIYYAMDPDTGAPLWQTQVGPGSSLGGMEWGSASDGKRIYVQIANLYGVPHAYGAASAGSWSALDPATGKILWQVADPNDSLALGPLAVADGVVYAPSMSGKHPTDQTMFALNAANGNVLWSFASGASVAAGAAVVDGNVYWGSGYTHLGIPGFTGNNTFYAFSKNGK
jgi:polyvinyl alcohol dehydrogenase (cytochrome)